MRLLLALALISLTALTARAEDGVLNPEEGGIAQLREALAARPERAGFICWVVYETQKGGAPLHGAAFQGLQDCAASGNAPSMILLAHAYENGLGTAPDPALATHWVKQAALQGYSMGQYHYAMALLRGTGVAQDASAARLWLERAAAGGSEDAAAVLNSLSM